jgi:dUTP pyrophosphatase
MIVFEPLFPDVEPPARATSHSSGYDLRAFVKDREVRVIRDGPSSFEAKIKVRDGRLTLSPKSRALVPLGFRARLPEGVEAQIRIRSSVAFKKGLTIPNAPGTIDADYPDEWMVMMRNDSGADVTIEHGERIAQVIFAKFETMEWTAGEVGISTDRKGGVGSTGSF